MISQRAVLYVGIALVAFGTLVTGALAVKAMLAGEAVLFSVVALIFLLCGTALDMAMGELSYEAKKARRENPPKERDQV